MSAIWRSLGSHRIHPSKQSDGSKLKAEIITRTASQEYSTENRPQLELLPPETELNVLFERLMVHRLLTQQELGLPPATIDQMRALSSDRKWLLIAQNRGHVASSKASCYNLQQESNDEFLSGRKMTASAYIQLLRQRPITKPTLEALASLEISLRTEPMQWLSGFVKLGGASVLTSMMLSFHSDMKLAGNCLASSIDESDVICTCLRALKALLNNPVGMQDSQAFQLGISGGVSLLEREIAKVRICALDFLAAVCSRSTEGQQTVLDQLLAGGIASIFLKLIGELEMESEQLQIATLKFLVSLSSGISDLKQRQQIIQLLSQLGFDRTCQARKSFTFKALKFNGNLLLLVQKYEEIVAQNSCENSLNLTAADLFDDFISCFSCFSKGEFDKILLSLRQLEVTEQLEFLGKLKKISDPSRQYKSVETQTTFDSSWTNVLDSSEGSNCMKSSRNFPDQNNSKDSYQSSGTEILNLSPPPPPPPPPLCTLKPLVPGPPPLLLPQAPPLKPKITPKSKLKAVTWNKLDFHLIKGSIWECLNADAILENTACLSELEKQFKVPKKEIGSRESSKKEIESRESAAKESEARNLLDPKKSQNVNIILSRLKISDHQLKQLLMEMDDVQLSEDLLKQLKSILPSQSERIVFEKFRGSRQNLDRAEKFLLEIVQIPRYEMRIDSLLFMSMFHEKIAELNPQVKLYRNCFMELQRSTFLPSIFKILLGLGNYMNSNTFRECSLGFSIEILPKLMNEADWSKIKTDFPNLVEACKVTFTAFSVEFSAFIMQTKKFLDEFELTKQNTIINPEDLLIKKMQYFINENEKEFDSSLKMKKEIDAEAEAICKYFSWDKRENVDELLQIIQVFVSSCALAVENIEFDQKRKRK